MDARVLDCFAGTGALGLEALSRGAAHVTFVDASRDAMTICKHNVAKFKEENACRFISGDASKLPAATTPYSLIFIDPPYFSKLHRTHA